MSSYFSIDQCLVFLFCVLLCLAALSDLRSFRIPNRLSLAIVLLFPLHVLASPVPVDVAMSILVAGSIFILGFVIFTLGLAGGGDIKLLSAASLWVGPALIGTELLTMALAGGVLALTALGVQYARRYAAGGIGGVIAPGSTIVTPKIPYGIAIAAGGMFSALKLLSA